MLYIAMRFVEGTDLRALIAARGPRSTRAARGAHRRARSAPRSTPPTRAGSCTATSSRRTSCSPRRDHVYLTDFGLAKQAADAERADAARAAGSARVDYVAPEQIQRRARRRARRRLRARLRAVRGAHRASRPFAARQRRRDDVRARRRPAAARRELRPDLPRASSTPSCARAMAKDPADRYPSAGDLARAAPRPPRAAPGHGGVGHRPGDALPRALMEAGVGRPQGDAPATDDAPAGLRGAEPFSWVVPRGCWPSWRPGWWLCWTPFRTSERSCRSAAEDRRREGGVLRSAGTARPFRPGSARSGGGS